MRVRSRENVESPSGVHGYGELLKHADDAAWVECESNSGGIKTLKQVASHTILASSSVKALEIANCSFDFTFHGFTHKARAAC